MNFKFSLHELHTILNNNLINTTNVSLAVIEGVATDTRTLRTGEIFIALTGEKFDGHNFVSKAIAKGAVGTIVSRPINELNVPQFVVKDTLYAYQQIARWWRDRFAIPVIGITGSVGKTTTKELIAAVLKTQGKVLKTQANFNNEIGVPKTLLEIAPEDNYAVIEMAMRASGEIALLTNIARPTIGVITNVGTAHIGRLGSVEAIAKAKCELLENMPTSSIAILNYDNSLLMETAAKVWQGETITYGLTGGNVRGELTDNNNLKVENQVFPLPLPGVHNASNYLAAIATAKTLEIDLTLLTTGLDVELPKGRARRYNLANDIVLLDETYNAGLESMLAALEMLKETQGNRHIAVLGTMKELGEHSAEFHYRVGEKARELEIDLLLVLADETATKSIADGAVGVMSECFSDRDCLIDRLKSVVRSGDRILFKASNSVGLNKAIEKIKEHQST
ncbi:UDP-N-acetylmuramoyl-tripeptide--D-alanyl-D-alanine ligase [Myxosarcina sp. GI1]|uniref:UDP-N-acetylmuramoyl-tripeptide--D-alanyl-D- alanine ligase n=1 Tax=Myxosarcina sp. GI1 TaxID=1541065 RepID=UPI000569317B|nr:UDP-N-acetylmuramoyl-tripeptide--D-alanyl-D-alanine ligase [Myxosarcina sp. GI1]